jgi:calmodulin
MDMIPIEERQDCIDIFALLDKNGNNTIDIKELGAGLRTLGLNPSLSEIKSMMQRFDNDGTNTLAFDEFIKVYINCLSYKSKREDEIKEQFRRMDKNGDGKLSCEELKELLMEGDEAFSEEELRMVFEEFDRNNDGNIDISELLEALIGE